MTIAPVRSGPAGRSAHEAETVLSVLSPHPLGATLPGLYADDSFAQRLCAGLDEVLAPAIAVLDCFPAYLDPRTAPPDLLDWLASWMGLVGAGRLPLRRRRALVTRAAELHAWRGTAHAVRELVQLATGHPAELEESGGTGWSRDAGTPLPGRAGSQLVVRVRVDLADPGQLEEMEDGEPEDEQPEQAGAGPDEELLTRLLDLVVPAHVPWRLELQR